MVDGSANAKAVNMLSAQTNSIVKPQPMAHPTATKDSLLKPAPEKPALNKSVIVKSGNLDHVTPKTSFNAQSKNQQVLAMKRQNSDGRSVGSQGSQLSSRLSASLKNVLLNQSNKGGSKAAQKVNDMLRR